MLMQIKIDFKAKIVTRHKENHFTIKRVNPLQRLKNYKHIYTQKQSPYRYETKTDRIEDEIENVTVIVGDVNTPLSKIDKTTRQMDGQQGNRKLHPQRKLSRPNRYLGYTLPKGLQNTSSPLAHMEQSLGKNI